eukprot:TRINITY_DN23714_c0_g1_i1.p1 TRINITY_DN23714_c0_g1~~TRINITY_DN23714_c0_g1_i1.p1  ORF type:complete len:225 (-),score=67.60 TRINITY_DN23714_c0_g1_i1:110-784(-)
MDGQLSLDPPGDGSTLEGFNHDGARMTEVTVPAKSETELLFETIQKVDFTHRLLGSTTETEQPETEGQAIVPEDHFKEAKERILLTIQEVQRLMQVVTLLHPHQSADGATLGRRAVEHPRISRNTTAVMKGATVLAKRQQLREVAQLIGRSANALEGEAEAAAARLGDLSELSRRFQLLGNAPDQGVVVQSSCPPAPRAQVQVTTGSDGAVSYTHLTLPTKRIV